MKMICRFLLLWALVLLYRNAPAQGEEQAIKPSGNFYGLIIGESQYDNPKLILDRPVKDAQKFKEIIISRYSFDEKNVELLSSPSRQQILSALFNLRKKVTGNDNLVIFYAGHGYWDDQASQGYWWPRDASIDDPANWLSNSDLKEQIRGIKSAHTLLISDACFSGGIFKTRSAAEAIKASSMNIQMLYKMPSRRAMTSGTLTTVPDESVFFMYLVKRLTENTEKFLPSEDLFTSLKQAVINNSMVVPQDGVIADSGDEGGDFIFILKDAPTGSSALVTAASGTSQITRGGTGAGPGADEIMDNGKEHLANKSFDEAYKDFSQAITLDAQNAQASNGRGRASMGLKKYDAAVTDFNKAIELNPNFAWAYYLRGLSRIDIRRFRLAIPDLTKAIEINPRYTYAYNARGFANMEMHATDEAMADFDKAIQLDAKFSFAYDNRGVLKIKTEKYDDAVIDFTKALEINPKFALAYSDLALAKLKQGKLDEASANVAKAFEIEPRLPRAFNCRGQIKLKQDKPDDAIADFTSSIEINPNYLEPFINRAKAYLAKKDYSNARADIDKVLGILPNNKEALAVKEEIQKNQK
jgi:tetratricopeptide (TPR) repeat protein